MKKSGLRAGMLLLLCMFCTACGKPGGPGGVADTVSGNQTVTGAEESSASDTTRKDGTTEKQLEKARPRPSEPAPGGTNGH